jgi:hypothetical protein
MHQNAQTPNNAEIADRLSALAQLLSMEKVNPYKISCYRPLLPPLSCPPFSVGPAGSRLAGRGGPPIGCLAELKGLLQRSSMVYLLDPTSRPDG